MVTSDPNGERRVVFNTYVVMATPCPKGRECDVKHTRLWANQIPYLGLC